MADRSPWNPRVRPEDLPAAWHAAVARGAATKPRAKTATTKAPAAPVPTTPKEMTMPRPKTNLKGETVRAREIREGREANRRKRRDERIILDRSPIFDPDTGQPYPRMTQREVLAATQGREWLGDAADTVFAPCLRCGGACGRSAKYVKPWRLHTGCAGSTPTSRAIAAVRELLGVEISATDAALVAAKVAVPAYRDLPDSQPHAHPGRPWSHVNKRKLKQAVLALPRLRAEAGVTPVRCASGPCAWCSVEAATGWEDFGHKWRDGSAAPLCGRCAEQWVRRGGLAGSLSTTYYEDQRRAGWNVLVGKDLPMGNGPDPAFKLYAEVADNAHVGTDVPFGYIAPTMRPGTVAYAERIAREKAEADALREQRRAEQAQAEQEQRRTWGFA